MITICILVVVYILSCIYNYIWLRKAHSKGGRYDVSFGDVLFAFFPIINIIVCLLKISLLPPIENGNFNEFFKVKK